MAGKVKARLIYSSISLSERVSGLGVKGALLFTWLLAHCDDQGRFAGNARKVKAAVVPLLDELGDEEVNELLSAMDLAGLIYRYPAGKRALIQVLDWWEFNRGLRFTAPSRYPAPPNWRDRVTGRDEAGRFRRSHEREP